MSGRVNGAYTQQTKQNKQNKQTKNKAEVIKLKAFQILYPRSMKMKSIRQ